MSALTIRALRAMPASTPRGRTFVNELLLAALVTTVEIALKIIKKTRNLQIC